MDCKNYYLNQLQSAGKIDYKTYYENQLKGGSFPVFTGYHNQRGHGIGGIFKRLSSFLMPLFKTHALPLLKKGGEALGTQVVQSAANIANDAIAGKNIEQSAKENFTNAVNNLAQKAFTQKGNGYKRKRKHDLMHSVKNSPKFKQRKLIDVFDSR